MSNEAYNPFEKGSEQEPTDDPNAWTEWAKAKITLMTEALAEARVDQAKQRDLVKKLEEVIKSHETLAQRRKEQTIHVLMPGAKVKVVGLGFDAKIVEIVIHDGGTMYRIGWWTEFNEYKTLLVPEDEVQDGDLLPTYGRLVEKT